MQEQKKKKSNVPVIRRRPGGVVRWGEGVQER